MSLYELPKIRVFKKGKRGNGNKISLSKIVFFSIVVSVAFGFLAGIVSSGFFYANIGAYLEKSNNEATLAIENNNGSQEQAIISAVKNSSPSVVSIIISKDLPIYEQYWELGPFGIQGPVYRQKGTEKTEVGGGTGFIISEEGLILTNKHVVIDDQAEYTVFTNNGKKFPAKVLAKDPFQDLAIIKIEQEKNVDENGDVKIEKFSSLGLGDSDGLEIGQTVIAIGNALGEFRNTVSSGLISGLGRSITASGESFSETLEDVIQTDAAINKGNSGGPLLNSKGEVIGINTAIATGAQSIGFAIPINYAKRDIRQVQTTGKIIYPFIGIRYVLINEKIKEEEKLSADYGALIVEGGPGEPAVSADSPAEKAGLKAGDIILEFNSERIGANNALNKILMKYNPGDEITFKILREEKEIEITLTLSERKE